jgi:hypothetical protein
MKKMAGLGILRQLFSGRDVSLGNQNDLAPVIADGHDPSIAVWHTLEWQIDKSVVVCQAIMYSLCFFIYRILVQK